MTAGVKKYFIINVYGNGHRTGTYLIRTKKQVDEYIFNNKGHDHIVEFIVFDVDSGRKVVHDVR